MKLPCRILTILFFMTVLQAIGAADRVGRYNVVWTNASRDAAGVMPLGNGDIAAGVYAIENGDLYLLLAKNDAYTYMGDIFKTAFNYGGYASGGASPAGVEPPQDVKFEKGDRILWYYAVGDRSIYQDDLKDYQVEHMASRFPDPFRFNTFGNLMEMKADGLSRKIENGALMGKGKEFDIRIHALTIQTPKPDTWIEAIEKQVSVSCDSKRDWEKHCAWWADFWDRSWIVASDNTLPPESREKFAGEPNASGRRTEEDGAALAAQSYNVFRFLMACQSRGRVQAKFNGGLFTQQLRLKADPKRKRAHAVEQPDGSALTHEDDRLWGRRFTFQNQRLLYWPLLASGDFEMMKPFFDYYSNLLDMRKAICKAWFGHDGAYYRENIEPTGAERESCPGSRILPPKTKPGEKYDGWYHDYYFTSGLEITAMMIDYVNYTGDKKFRDNVLVPFAREVLLFFDQHYQRGPDGKVRLDPIQVVETWWIAVNSAPDISGPRFCLGELLAMKAGTSEDQSRWRKLLGEVPEVFLQTIDGRKAIAPAEKWEKKHNAENGELYPVFPFRCFGLVLGSADIVEWTMKNRSCKDAFGCACWTQDQIHWAYAGNAAEAADGLVRRFRIATPVCRFPMYGREGPDSCPDFDHFGAGSVALQRMLVQEGNGPPSPKNSGAASKILLLPAWPSDWDADFKLHLSRETVITGTLKQGKLITWDIQPASRKADVIVCQPQAGKPAAPPVPANNHPLRAGSDSNGGNTFKGTIGRVTMFRGKITAALVSELAAGDRSKPVVAGNVVGSWLNPTPGDKLETKPDDFGGPVSFEVWIRPGDKESGRILDKLTAGTGDGFLLDTWPNLSLRLIVGGQQTSFPDVLKPGAWQHVAVVIERGGQSIYIDGKVAH